MKGSCQMKKVGKHCYRLFSDSYRTHLQTSNCYSVLHMPWRFPSTFSTFEPRWQPCLLGVSFCCLLICVYFSSISCVSSQKDPPHISYGCQTLLNICSLLTDPICQKFGHRYRGALFTMPLEMRETERIPGKTCIVSRLPYGDSHLMVKEVSVALLKAPIGRG